MSAAPREAQLGFWMCTALVVGNMIASGIFLLPASLAPYGLNSIVAWLVTAAGALFIAAVCAALGRVYPSACGPYDYARIAFGELAGFVVAWVYWISIWVSNAAIATASISYLSDFFPALAFEMIKRTEGSSAEVDIARGVNFYDEVKKFEIDLIRRALNQTGGHQSRAARLLGLNATTLNSKIKNYNIQDYI